MRRHNPSIPGWLLVGAAIVGGLWLWHGHEKARLPDPTDHYIAALNAISPSYVQSLGDAVRGGAIAMPTVDQQAQINAVLLRWKEQDLRSFERFFSIRPR